MKGSHGTGIEWTQWDERRFRAFTDRGPECWLWNGGCTPNGYGKFWLNGSTIGAHVMAYALANNGDRPVVVRHTCDNPPCVRPNHLIGGTQRDNLLDARERGHTPKSRRGSTLRAPLKAVDGERNGNSVLNTHDVLTIRDRYHSGEAVTIRSLAQEYGVSKSQIHNVLTGKAWASV